MVQFELEVRAFGLHNELRSNGKGNSTGAGKGVSFSARYLEQNMGGLVGSVAGYSVFNPAILQQDAARPAGVTAGPEIRDSSTGAEAAKVSLSAAGLAAAGAGMPDQSDGQRGAESATTSSSAAAGAAKDGESAGESTSAGTSAKALQLTPEELKLVEDLKARDREVRAHEQAHQAVAGGLAGGATYTYQRGPDGVSYAVGGEVSISLREGRTAQETIANAQTVRAAALAPADPSSQDRAVAAQATQIEANARAELAAEKRATAAEAAPASGGSTPSADSSAPAGAPLPVPGAASADSARGPGVASPSSAASPRPPDGSAPSSSQSESSPGVAAVERARAGLDKIYGLIAANSSGFAASA